MPEIKRSLEATQQLARLRDKTLPEFEDVTALFTPPPELLLQTSERDEAMTAVQIHPAMLGKWDTAEDEATLVVRESFPAFALLESKRVSRPPATALPEVAPIAPPSSNAPARKSPDLAPAGRFQEYASTSAPPARNLAPLGKSPASVAIDVGDAELGAILGPRRAARWLAFGGVLTLVLILIAVARLAP